MGVTPASWSRWRASTTSSGPSRRAPPGARLHNISCWMKGGDELLEAFCEAAGVDAQRPSTAAPARPTARSSSPASSASGPATSRRWLRSTSATTARSTATTRRRRRAAPIRRRGAARTRRSQAAGGRRPGARDRPGDEDAVRQRRRPGIATIETYRRPAATGRSRRHTARWIPRTCCASSRIPGFADAAAPASRWEEGLVPPPRRHGEVPVLQRRRVRAGGLQGPRADVEEPASAGRGHRDRGARRRRRPHLHLHPRRVRRGRRPPRRAVEEAYEAGYLGDNVLGTGVGSSSSSTAAPAPTSAARRRRCSTRSRASAATRA